jgi:FlaA1/EpsC-like NDP-sugar epimerase
MLRSVSPAIQLRPLARRLLLLRNRHFLAVDLLILSLTPSAALLLRTDTVASLVTYFPSLLLYTVGALLLRLSIFLGYDLYRRWWRYASNSELVLLLKAFGASTALVLAGFGGLDVVGEPWFNLPRSVPLIDTLLALTLIICNHISLRLVDHWLRQTRQKQEPLHVLIMGAGHTGQLIAREIQENPHLNLHLVGFLDDDPAKHGMRIHGVPVAGDRHMVTHLGREQAIDRVIIAMPTAPGREVRQILALCREAGVKTQTVPGMHELINGSLSINHLRNVQIEDLLRRAPIQTDTAAVHGLLRGQRVLVTGAGGSIGSELCRQILRCQPAQLLLLGHGENSIFEILHELQRIQTEIGSGGTTLIPIIADLRFPERLQALFAQHRPQIVFHAAAHKHVPLMEAHPAEAVLNNIYGTQNVLAAAQAVDVAHFVMISTDKAVNPTSVMGAAKRVAEFLVHQAAKQSGRAYQVVRFGNVLGSRGSVVLTFRQQIASGGPVTITHPDMVRYFMTIPEAVQLVLQASVLGKGGEVFMLDMGQPIKIEDLARDLIQLSGLEVGQDIDIVYSGLRPGEKLFEEMFTPGESYTQTNHEKVLIAANASHFIPPLLGEAVAALVADARCSDTAAILRRLRMLVPEYAPPLPAPAALAGPGMRRPRQEPPAPFTLQTAAAD